MANYRQIHTQIWRDDWFSELPPDEKLLFIYLFSNDSSSLTGLYKLSLRVMVFETGLELEFIKTALGRFETEKRVVYRDGIVWVVNMWRYHSNASPKVRTRIENDLKHIPDSPIKRAYQHYQHTGLFNEDTISILYGYLIGVADLNLNKLNQEEEQPMPAATSPKMSTSRSIAAILNKVGMSAMPPSEYQRTEQLICMVEVHGQENTEDACVRNAKKWTGTNNKQGKPYPITNMGWVDWAQNELDAGGNGNGKITLAKWDKMSEEERYAHVNAGGDIPYE